jgi:hypothetical protein
MIMIRRIIQILLGFVIVFTGCLSACSPTELTSQSVVAKTISEIAAIKSYQLDTDVSDNNGTEWKGLKVVSVPDKEMWTRMSITFGPFNVSDEMYFKGGEEYCKTISEGNLPPTIGWTKNKLDETVWNQQSQMPLVVELLKNATQFTALENEQLDGINCYVVTVIPSSPASVDWVLSQGQPGGPAMTTWSGDTLVRSDAYKDGTVKLWINKDSYFLLKAEISIVFQGELNPGTAVTTPYTAIGDLLYLSFEGQLIFSNYNQPVSIQIPPEALNTK